MTIGCIHGRFQPFHNGHYEYLLAASNRCNQLIIGITQYDPETTDAGSPVHRMNRVDNPFTYWERHRIIKAVIAEAKLPAKTFDIVPFPIHSPEMIKNFVDPKSVMFTTIYDMWNIQKVRRLRQQGFDVRILWRRRVKEIEGKVVREAMRHNRELFNKMVPAGTSETVGEIEQARLVRDSNTSNVSHL